MSADNIRGFPQSRKDAKEEAKVDTLLLTRLRSRTVPYARHVLFAIIFPTLNYYNYFTEIEETFVRRRGKHLLLSPIDWAMIEAWQDRGVPLHIVIRAIESVFDGFDKNPGPRSIKGLLYCKEEVEAQFKEWTEMQAGKAKAESSRAPDLGSETVVEHIGQVIEELDKCENVDLREDIDRAIIRLREIGANHSNDVETADHSLSDIENFLEHAPFTAQG